MTLFHPRQRTLVAFALGNLERRARVARHLEHCFECRQLVGFTQRLSSAVATSPPPVPDDGILVRALASRARGDRCIVGGPAEMTASFHPGPWLLSAGTVVGVAAIIAFALVSGPAGGDYRGVNELLLAGLTPRSAEAAQGVTAGGALTHRLRPIATTYRRRIIDRATGLKTEWGLFDVRITPSPAQKAWVITSGWREIENIPDMQKARAWTESVTVADPSLAPIRRIVHVTPYRRWAGIYIDQYFRGDSVIGQMSLDQDPMRRPIARDIRAARGRLIASDALSPFWLMGVPLVRGTAIDGSVLGWAVVPNDVVLGVRMEVIGSERIETPAGTFDCWKLSISVGKDTHYHWVRKTDHLGVLTRRRLEDGNTREIILTREATP